MPVAACQPPEDARAIQIDLVEEAPRALWLFPDGPSARMSPTFEVYPRRRGRDDRLEARVHFRGAWPPGRRLLLGLEVAGDPAGLPVSVALGDGPAVTHRLAPGRHALVVEPPPRSRPALMLVASAPLDPAPSHFSIRHLGLVPSGWPSPAPSPFEGAGPALLQPGPSEVRFVSVLPPQPELRFTPSAPPGSGPVRLRVTCATEGSTSRDLWSATLAPGQDADEVVLPLPEDASEPVQVGLHVDGDSPGSTGLWTAPRILGSGPAPRLRPAPLRPGAARRAAEPLTASLRGVNVLIVLLDAARASHFGSYGYERPTTPEIDGLAREGVLFEQAYAPAPFTVASVSSMWTSLYPDAHHFGVRHSAPLPPEHPTLAELLKERGVTSAGFVANPSGGGPYGLARGFDEFHHLYELADGSTAIARAPAFRGPVRRWLETVRDRPFFGYVHFLEPHFPYDPPPPFDTLFGPDGPLPRSARRDNDWVIRANAGRVRVSREERQHLVRLYDGNLAFVDREVGWLRDTLEELGLLERTVILVTSDHGEDLYERRLIGHGGLVNEESLHIPLILRLPTAVGLAGLRVEGLVDLLDVAPTVLDLFQVPAPETEIQGQTLVPMLAGAPGKGAVLGRTMQERPTYSLRDDRWTLIHSFRNGDTALHDRVSDPGERQNVAERYPIRTELLRQELARWLGAVRTRRGSGPDRSLTPDEEEMLRSLGYVP